MQTVTFYSYKGGVGRTLALASVATELAVQGRHVVAWDLDLEAPGLHHKLQPSTALKQGFVDLVHSFRFGQPAPPSLEPYLVPVKLPAGAAGSLRVLAAGASDHDTYWRKLVGISWQDLFYGGAAAGVPFLLGIQERIRDELGADFLLIDSRTGVTELGGAALTLLPDTIVALGAYNTENFEGLRAVLRATLRARREAAGVSDGPSAQLRVLPVLTRIPEADTDEEAELVRELQLFLNEPAPALPDTLTVDLPVVVHSDPVLLLNEGRALRDDNRLVHADLARLKAELCAELWQGPDQVNRRAPAHLEDSVEAARQRVALVRRRSSASIADETAAIAALARVLTRAGRATEARQLARRQVDALLADEGSHGSEEGALAVLDLVEILDNLGEDPGRASVEPKLKSQGELAWTSLVEESGQESHADRAIRWVESGAASTNIVVAVRAVDVLDRRAAAHQGRGRYRHARHEAQRALRWAERALPATHPSRAHCTLRMALANRRLGELDEAESLLLKAIDVAETNSATESFVQASLYSNLAAVLKDLGRLAEAEILLRKAIDLQEDSFESERGALAVFYSNLGTVLGSLGRLAEAEAFLLRALEVMEASYGPAHPRLAVPYMNLAGLLHDTGRQSEAEGFLLKAIAVQETSFEHDHPTLATMLVGLAQLRLAQQRSDEAAELLTRALRIRRAALPASHPDIVAVEGSLRELGIDPSTETE